MTQHTPYPATHCYCSDDGTVVEEVSGLVLVTPEGGKVARLNAVAPLFEAGNVLLPDPTLRPWVHDYIEELATFPGAPHDDQVDANDVSTGDWTRVHCTALNAYTLQDTDDVEAVTSCAGAGTRSGGAVLIVPNQVEPGSNEEASWASKSPDGASLVDCRDLAPSPEEGDVLVVSEAGCAIRYADDSDSNDGAVAPECGCTVEDEHRACDGKCEDYVTDVGGIWTCAECGCRFGVVTDEVGVG
jgi:hypothetical protein